MNEIIFDHNYYPHVKRQQRTIKTHPPKTTNIHKKTNFMLHFTLLPLNTTINKLSLQNLKFALFPSSKFVSLVFLFHLQNAHTKPQHIAFTCLLLQYSKKKKNHVLSNMLNYLPSEFHTNLNFTAVSFVRVNNAVFV